MILKQDVATDMVAEIIPILVFAIRHESIPFLIVALVFEKFHAIQPMLHVIAFNNDHRSIEFIDIERLVFRSRNQVVHGTQLAVTLHA